MLRIIQNRGLVKEYPCISSPLNTCALDGLEEEGCFCYRTPLRSQSPALGFPPHHHMCYMKADDPHRVGGRIVRRTVIGDWSEIRQQLDYLPHIFLWLSFHHGVIYAPVEFPFYDEQWHPMWAILRTSKRRLNVPTGVAQQEEWQNAKVPPMNSHRSSDPLTKFITLEDNFLSGDDGINHGLWSAPSPTTNRERAVMSSSRSPVPLALNSLGISLDETFGANLLLTFCGLILYGFSLHQMYRYFRTFPNDDKFVRVIGQTTPDTEVPRFNGSQDRTNGSLHIHNASEVHIWPYSCPHPAEEDGSYYMLVTNFSDVLSLLNGVWSLNALPTVSILRKTYRSWQVVISIVSSDLADPDDVVGPKYRLIVIVASIILLSEFAAITDAGSTGFAIAIAYKGFTVALSFDSGGSRASTIRFTSRNLVDTINRATSLVLTFTFIACVLRLADVLLTGSIFNGAAFLACLATSPFSYTYGIPEIIATRLYANTLLCAPITHDFLCRSLNSRDPKKALSIFDGGSYGRNLIQRMNHRAAAETWNVPQIPDDPQAIHINVTTEAEGALDIKRDSAPQYKHHIV
ncbi:hypothetical protein BD309DRAFT_984432 [Dichomitus squalens]|uniref:Uncharacterized protein n=1 Tax=Dichomitus squalens TaxID=114155 RepID=A0A4Q9NDK7_9APHY|nr:hypothetical protein BD309DRAFT_984432 [Dichomitus squalens]TBU55999.1 hypothetical protein BD310DRAFT_908016 [Dichomitus squalens]